MPNWPTNHTWAFSLYAAIAFNIFGLIKWVLNLLILFFLLFVAIVEHEVGNSSFVWKVKTVFETAFRK